MSASEFAKMLRHPVILDRETHPLEVDVEFDDARVGRLVTLQYTEKQRERLTEVAKEVRELCARLKLRHFFKQLKGVRVWPEDERMLAILVKWEVLNREPPHQPIIINFHGTGVFDWRLDAKKEALCEAVRYAIETSLLHEVQECIYFDDERVFEPHKETPR